MTQVELEAVFPLEVVPVTTTLTPHTRNSRGLTVDLSSFSEREMEPQRESVICLSVAGWGPVLGYLSGALMSPDTVAPSFPHMP